ncbi:MAG: hypothetical protein M0002_08775 [Rhodospirillales bacterium]|nr:hypothetical protein [Rhodospirillales bacterium]
MKKRPTAPIDAPEHGNLDGGPAAAARQERAPILDVILRRMREPASVSEGAFFAASQAAPYLHPGLAAVAMARQSG